MSNNKTNPKKSQDVKNTPPFESPSAQDPPKKAPRPSKTPTERDKMMQDIIVKTILWMTTIGIFVSTIGLILAIGDMFSTEKLALFMELSFQSKLFVLGIILLGIFFLVLFLVVFYKRGRKNIKKNLFKEITQDTRSGDEAYQIAKYIAAGALVAVFLIFTGLIIALFEFLFGTFAFDIIPDFWKDLTGGTYVLVISLIFLLFDGLLYSMIFIWENGHSFVIDSILIFNEKTLGKHDFTKNQQTVGKVLFALIVAELIGIVFGVVWAIIESFTGDWGALFRDYPIGIQISFYGIFASLFFGTMVFSMFFYKRGNNLIMTALFVQYQPKGARKDNISAKVITIGILVAILFMFGGLIIWLIALLIEVLGSETATNLFMILAELSSGLTLLAYSTLIGVFTILALLFSYFFHNGYYVTLEKIMALESKIDSDLDEGLAKAEERKADRKKERKGKKKKKK
ncbi:MAG: hypothetical protein ACTSVZ_11095 [Promethearchaeota archaeon]